MPFVASSQNDGLLIPDCGGDAGEPRCNFAYFLKFINDIIKFLILYISIPVAVLLFLYAGILYLTTPITDKKTQAKNIFLSVIVGFVIMIGAFLFIDFILDFFLDEKFKEVPNLAQ